MRSRYIPPLSVQERCELIRDRYDNCRRCAIRLGYCPVCSDRLVIFEDGVCGLGVCTYCAKVYCHDGLSDSDCLRMAWEAL